MPENRSPLERLRELFDVAPSADAQAIEAQAVAEMRPHRGGLPVPPELQGEETTGEVLKRNLVSAAEAFTEAAPAVGKGVGEMLISPFPGAIELPSRIKAAIQAARGNLPSQPTAAETVAGVTGINPARMGERLAERDYGGVIGEAAPAVAALLAGGRLLRRLKPAELQAPVSPEVAELRRMFNKPGAEIAEPKAVGAQVAEKPAAEAAPVEQPAAAPSNVPRMGEAVPPSEKYAVNINLERIAAPEDVKNVIKEVAEANRPQLEAQGRNVRTNVQTAKAAEQLSLSPDELRKVAPGTAWNAEQLYAARQVNVKTATEVRDALKAVQAANSDENLIRLQKAIQQHSAVLQTVSGLTSEAGRALQQFKMAASALAEKTNYDKVLQSLGGREVTEEVARKLAQIDPNDLPALNKFLREQSNFSTLDKVHSYWINSILSGPRSHARNVISNVTFGLIQLPQRAIKGWVDYPLSKLAGRPQEFFAREAIPASYGWLAGTMDGLRRAAHIVARGYDMMDAGKLDAPRQFEFSGAAKVFSMPSRLLVAEDSMSKPCCCVPNFTP